MFRFSRFIEALYHIRVVGPLLSTLGSLVRVGQWRIQHANLISQQARLLAEQASRVASREAALEAQINELGRSVELQAAVTSTIQRLARGEAEKAELASRSAVASRDELQRSLADHLNAGTLNSAALKALREEIRELRDGLDGRVAAVERELQRRAGALESELNERGAVLDGLETQLAQRAGALEGELAKRAAILDAVQSRLDALAQELNPHVVQAQLASLRSAVEYLTSRVEFVRRETLFEMRYGGSVASGGNAGSTEPRIINPQKVKQADGALKVNVGCGHIALDGYVNVDRRELPGVDVVADANRMPFAPGTVLEMFSAHLLEHFPQEQLRREILPYWKSLLKPGGQLRAVVPDAEAMIREYAAGRYSYDDLRLVTFGDQDYDGDFHYNMFTPTSLSALLREAGFSHVEVPVTGRRNGACYEFEVVAS